MEREPEVSGAASIRDLGGQVGVLAKQRLSGAFLRAGAVDRCLGDSLCTRVDRNETHLEIPVRLHDDGEPWAAH